MLAVNRPDKSNDGDKLTRYRATVLSSAEKPRPYA